MEVQFRMAEPDYVSANWTYLKQRPWRFVLGYRFPIGLAAVALLIIAKNPERWVDVGCILAVGLTLIGYIFLAHRWSWHRQFQQQGLGERLISLTIDAQSVRLREKTNELASRWDEISFIHEAHLIFMFGTVKGKLIYLPKTAMSQTQIHELKMLIAANARCKVRLTSSAAA